MTEKINRISNPLTIIAIFAGLAEISATISIGFIDKNLQEIFIWFLVGFPTLLVLLFFITLNFNTKVLYSPSDYKDEKDFVKVLFPKKMANDLDDLNGKVKTIIDNKRYDELVQVSNDIEKIKEKFQQIPINTAWDLNHWQSNYASLEGDRISFSGMSSTHNEDGCNIDLLDFLDVGKKYEVSCFVISDANTDAKFKLWCHDKAGTPNGMSCETHFKTPSTSGEIFNLIFDAVHNRNIRVHLQYLAGKGKIEVSEVRIKELG